MSTSGQSLPPLNDGINRPHRFFGAIHSSPSPRLADRRIRNKTRAKVLKAKVASAASNSASASASASGPLSGSTVPTGADAAEALEKFLLSQPRIADGDQQLGQHLDAVQDHVALHRQPRQITEATGEAAAALCMKKRFPGAKMEWGMQSHSGAGIDQIWSRESSGVTTYYIVEAKGPGAELTYKNIGPPPKIRQQMSFGWVLDNLVRMAKQEFSEFDIARTILKEMGFYEALNETGGPLHYQYGGASKSYYACGYSEKSPGRVSGTKMIGVVVKAVWPINNPNKLSYTVSIEKFDLTNKAIIADC